MEKLNMFFAGIDQPEVFWPIMGMAILCIVCALLSGGKGGDKK